MVESYVFNDELYSMVELGEISHHHQSVQAIN